MIQAYLVFLKDYMSFLLTVGHIFIHNFGDADELIAEIQANLARLSNDHQVAVALHRRNNRLSRTSALVAAVYSAVALAYHSLMAVPRWVMLQYVRTYDRTISGYHDMVLGFMRTYTCLYGAAIGLVAYAAATVSRIIYAAYAWVVGQLITVYDIAVAVYTHTVGTFQHGFASICAGITSVVTRGIISVKRWTTTSKTYVLGVFFGIEGCAFWIEACCCFRL